MSNLKRVRQGAHLTQAELAEKSGVNIRTIQNYERGARDINRAEALLVYKLAKAMGRYAEDILEIKS